MFPYITDSNSGTDYGRPCAGVEISYVVREPGSRMYEVYTVTVRPDPATVEVPADAFEAILRKPDLLFDAARRDPEWPRGDRVVAIGPPGSFDDVQYKRVDKVTAPVTRPGWEAL